MAGCAWAVAYVPIHLYWALTGETWPVGALPPSIQPAQWRQANWAATVIVLGAALLALALVQHWGRRLPRWMLLGVAWVAAPFAILHWLAISLEIVLRMTGVIDGGAITFDRWNVLLFEPWFLGMGILLVAAAIQNTLVHRRRASTSPPAPLSVAGRVSTAFVLIGLFVVLVGVMSFQAMVYLGVGLGLIGIGLLCGWVVRRRERTDGGPSSLTPQWPAFGARPVDPRVEGIGLAVAHQNESQDGGGQGDAGEEPEVVLYPRNS